MPNWFDALFPFYGAIADPSWLNIVPAVWTALLIALAAIASHWILSEQIGLSVARLIEMEETFEDLLKGEMRERLGRLRQIMADHPHFGHHWRRFLNSILMVKADDEVIELVTEENCRDYLNQATLIEPVMNLPLIRSIPLLLITFGAMGALASLTLGLASEPADSLTGLEIAAPKAAFLMIWSLGLAGGLVLQQKFKMDALRRALASLQKTVDNAFNFRPPGAWLDEAIQQIRQQSEELQNFNKELSLDVVRAMDLFYDMKGATEQLIYAVEELKKAKEESTLDAAQQLAREFHHRLTGDASQEIAKLGIVLDEASTEIKETIRLARENQGRLEVALEMHLGQLHASISELTSDLQQVQTNLNQQTLSTMQTFLTQIEERLVAQQNQVRAHVNEIDQLFADRVTTVFQEFSGLGNLFKEQSEAAAENFNQSLDRVSELYSRDLDGAGRLLKEIQKAGSNLEVLLEGMVHAGKVFEATAQPVHEAAGGLTEAVADLRQALLSGVVRPIARTAPTGGRLSRAAAPRLEDMPRAEILLSLEQRLRDEGIKGVVVEVSECVLRIPERHLFEPGKFKLLEDGQSILATLAGILHETLKNEAFLERLRAIVIEGHTDSSPIVDAKKQMSHWDLSFERAKIAWKALQEAEPKLAQLENSLHEKLFTCLGYAYTRPITAKEDPRQGLTNARIDFVFHGLSAPGAGGQSPGPVTTKPESVG